jgi:hypothetical protein
LEQSDVLFALAEVSVAFAGFSRVVAAFGRRDPGTWSFTERRRFYALIEISLVALFFCVVPFCLSALHLSDAYVWRTASALFATYLVVSNILSRRRFLAAPPSDTADASPTATRLLRVVDMIGLALSLYNLAILGEVGPFLLALLLLLMQAGFLFARILVLSFGGGRAA